MSKSREHGQKRLTFGKHNGKRLDECPLPYLDWLLGQTWFKPSWPNEYRMVSEYMSDPAIQVELGHELQDKDDDEEDRPRPTRGGVG